LWELAQPGLVGVWRPPPPAAVRGISAIAFGCDPHGVQVLEAALAEMSASPALVAPLTMALGALDRRTAPFPSTSRHFHPDPHPPPRIDALGGVPSIRASESRVHCRAGSRRDGRTHVTTKMEPTGIFSPEGLVDPYPFFQRLRDRSPVFDSESEMWCLLRFQDVYGALRDHATFSSNTYGEGDVDGIRLVLITDDPPRHTRF